MTSSGTSAAFYCVADASFFIGAVGLVNSLRLQGHDEPIYLLDLGMTTEQRDLLTREVELVTPGGETAPWLSKTRAPLAHPAETMVLIDVDMIVTRPLGQLIERATGGRVLAFENKGDRFFPEWEQLLDLGPLERRPYACSGLVIVGGEIGAETIRLLDDLQGRADVSAGYYGRDEPGYPFRYPEQDVLNAILASSAVPRDRVEVLPFPLAPMAPFEGLEVTDAEALRCAYSDGTEPYVVHHYGAKPWLEPTHDGVYSILLRRALANGPLRIEPRRLPLRLREGIAARAERKRIDFGERLRWLIGGTPS